MEKGRGIVDSVAQRLLIDLVLRIILFHSIDLLAQDTGRHPASNGLVLFLRSPQ